MGDFHNETVKHEITLTFVLRVTAVAYQIDRAANWVKGTSSILKFIMPFVI